MHHTYYENPAARGVTVTTRDVTFQIVQIKGEARLYFVPRIGDGWSSGWTSIHNPDRFGRMPDSRASFIAWVQAFVARNYEEVA